jgi:hypothetical protein
MKIRQKNMNMYTESIRVNFWLRLNSIYSVLDIQDIIMYIKWFNKARLI